MSDAAEATEDLEDVIAYVAQRLRKLNGERAHVIMEIHLRDGQPTGAVHEKKSTHVKDIPRTRLTVSKSRP